MDEKRPYASPVLTDPEEQVAAIRELIDLVESGQVESGALRVYGADGTVQEIVFGDSEEKRAAALAGLRAALARYLH